MLSPLGPSALRPSGLPPRSPAEIAEQLGDRLASYEAGAAPEALVTGVTLDSRAVRPGDLYAALPGSRAHGAQYVGDRFNNNTGTRVAPDYLLFDDTGFDQSWDGVWSVATRVDSAGWTAEFAIPFQQLRFNRR